MRVCLSFTTLDLIHSFSNHSSAIWSGFVILRSPITGSDDPMRRIVLVIQFTAAAKKVISFELKSDL